MKHPKSPCYGAESQWTWLQCLWSDGIPQSHYCHITFSGTCNVAGGVFVQCKYMTVTASWSLLSLQEGEEWHSFISAHTGHVFVSICCVPTLCHSLREMRGVLCTISGVEVLPLRPSLFWNFTLSSFLIEQQWQQTHFLITDHIPALC